MSNSPLVSYTRISPNKSSRTQDISKITVHYMAGNLSVETCGEVFAPSSRQASSNYGVGSDGRVGMYVPENYRAWTSSSAWNDQRAVTIEVANIDPYGTFTTAAWNTLVDLVVDICERNGIPELIFTGDQYGTLTWHCMFASTSCPGNYFKDNTYRFCDEVNARLRGEDMPLTNEDIAAIWAYGGAGPTLISSYNMLNTIQNKVAPAMPVAAADLFVYRLEKDGVHHWTSNQIEADDLIGAGWKIEGEAFQAHVAILIHRLTTDRDEFLTVYIDEVYEAIKAGYSYNGIAGVAAAYATDDHEGLTPVCRLIKDGLHMMTANEGEIAALVADGWTDEGVAFYV